MARTEFDASTMLQVFRGSRLPLGVYAKHAGRICCGSAFEASYDRLADVVHGPNSHTHLRPAVYNDKYLVPQGPVGGNLENDRDAIVTFINKVGVGAKIGILCIPNYAFITDIGVHIDAEESGLTFNLITRNGLTLPSSQVIKVTTAADEDNVCALSRTEATSDTTAFNNIGALDGASFIDIIGRDGNGVFTAEADEIQLEVASLPTTGRVIGNFRIMVSVNYSVVMRAERE